MASNQGRQEGSIDPADGPLAVFAIGLRDLREECGRPTYRELATLSAKVGSPYSDTTFSTAARGHTPPSQAVVTAYVRACLAHAGADERKTARTLEEWNTRWATLDAALSPARPAKPSAERPVVGPRPQAVPTTEEADPEQPVKDSGHRQAPVATRRFRGRNGAPAILGGVAILAGLGLGLGFGARYIAAPGSAAAGSVPPAAAPAGAPPSADGPEGNSRCARPRYAGALAWSPCTRIDGARLVFAVQLSNTGKEPVTVKVKLAYVRAGAAYECPGRWGTEVRLDIPPGETVTSPETACTTAKLPNSAFQAKAWVTTPGEHSWGYREMSQTVHVQEDGATTVWADEG